jgi:hypothetical protein
MYRKNLSRMVAYLSTLDLGENMFRLRERVKSELRSVCP